MSKVWIPALTGLAFLFFTFSAFGRTRPLITTPIDNSARVQIQSSHLVLKDAVDLGAVDAGKQLDRMVLVLGSAPQQQHEATTLLDAQQTKGSANYHKWLTPAQYGEQFGPAPEDVAQVTAWLEQQGFSVARVATSGSWIEFSGTAGLVNRTFQTQLRRYKVNGRTHIANASDLSIPAAMASLVKGVPLHDFFSKPAFVKAQAGPAITASNGAHAVTPSDLAAIYNFTSLYKTNLNGSGQTIAIVAKSDINLSDVAQFQKIFELPSNVPNVIDNGVSPGVTPVGGYGAEATLDTEWAAAMAPGAKIDVVASWDTSTTDGTLLSAMYIVDQNLASVVNVSFTVCEQNLDAATNALISSIWQQAAAQGMSVFVASGDSGAAACDAPGLAVLVQGPLAVNGLSSTPYDTSVGGTSFEESVNGGKDGTFWKSSNGSGFESAIGYIPEMVWDDSCPGTMYCPGGGYIPFFAGTGGGVSAIYPTPSWQTLNVTGLQILGNYSLPGQSGVTPRGVPDISLAAESQHDPYLFCFTDPFHPDSPDCQLQNGTFGPNTFQNVAGGTSFAAPVFAGLMAIINQKMADSNPGTDGRQGLANYVLYPLAAAEDFSSCNANDRTNPAVADPAGCTFNDITVGNNQAGLYHPELSYNTGVGYDLATGLGSVDAARLVTAWANAEAGFHGSQTTLAAAGGANSISISHGQSASFDVTVQKMNGDTTAQVPVGSVSLVASGGSLTNSVGVAGAGLSGNPATTGSFSTSLLPGGNYNLVASFPGDGFFGSSVSNTTPVIVTPEATTTTLYSQVTEPYGTNITQFTADVAGASGQGYPSGIVSLTENGTQFAQIKLNNQGVARWLNCPFLGGIQTPAPMPVPCFLPGTHVITAAYGGDGSFSPSPNPPAASQIVTLTITKGSPFVQVFSGSDGPNTVNETFTLTAYLGGVSPYAVLPTGTVQFLDGTTSLGQTNVTTPSSHVPQAAMQTTLSQGKHNITVNYSGDSLYAPQIVTTEFDNGVPIGWIAKTTTQTVNPGQAATYNLTLSTVTGFTGQVPLSCIAGTDAFQPGTAPPGVQCSLSIDTATLDTNTTSVPVVVTITTTSQSKQASLGWMIAPFAVTGIFAVGWRRNRLNGIFGLFLVAGLALAMGTSCGGNRASPQPTGPSAATATYTVWSSYPGQQPGYTVYNGVVLTLNINP
jgi:large repetitive protein